VDEEAHRSDGDTFLCSITEGSICVEMVPPFGNY
jgi:hypothetical protein